jgi:predicted nucleic acid-binding protein
MNYFETIPFNLSIETIAIDLIQRLGMKSLDSIQLASAKISNCEMMVVSDKQLFARAESENFWKFRFI